MDRDVKPHADTPEQPWMERSIAGLLRLLGGTVTTFLDLCVRPWRSAVRAGDDAPAAPPISFLVVTLLFSGIAARAFVLYLTRDIDGEVASVMSDAIDQWGPKQILLVTLPVVTLIVMAGLGAARVTRPSADAFHNPIVRGVCYASGFQIFAIGLFAVAFLLSKFVRGHDAVASRLVRDDALFLFIAVVVVSGAIQIERIIKVHGLTRLAANRPFRCGLALSTSLVVFVGIVTAGVFSFDLFSVAKESQHKDLLAEVHELGESGVSADVISTVSSRTPDGLLRIEQTFLLANRSEQRWAVPRPSALEPVKRLLDHAEANGLERPQAITVESCSIDWSDSAGWILDAGESRIVRWSLVLPKSLMSGRSATVVEFVAARAPTSEDLALDTLAGGGRKRVLMLIDWAESVPKVAAEVGNSNSE